MQTRKRRSTFWFSNAIVKQYIYVHVLSQIKIESMNVKVNEFWTLTALARDCKVIESWEGGYSSFN